MTIQERRPRLLSKTIHLLLAIFLFVSANAQVGINSDGTAPHNSAQLEVKSNNKGLLIPRIADPAQAVTAPAEGLLLYNSTARQPSFFNGSTWVGMGNDLSSRFPNSVGFAGRSATSSPNQTISSFTVPAGITQIWVELWGGGDAGTALTSATTASDLTAASGGNGGDYASMLFPVTPGAVLDVKSGNGGAGTVTGGNSSITVGIDTWEVRQGGFGIYLNNAIASQIPGLLQYMGGGDGTRGSFIFSQVSTTEFRRIIYCGNGGNAYPAQAGGEGLTLQYNITTGVIIPSGLVSIIGNAGMSPGGGGGGGYGNGGNGGIGMIIIHY